MNKQELETRLAIAYAQRKQANALRVPRYVISEINRQIRHFQNELGKVAA